MANKIVPVTSYLCEDQYGGLHTVRIFQTMIDCCSSAGPDWIEGLKMARLDSGEALNFREDGSFEMLLPDWRGETLILKPVK